MITATGAFYIAPMLHFWYCKALPVISTRLNLSSHRAMVATKLALDQTIFASLITTGFYIFLNGISKRSLEAGIKDVRDRFKSTMLANWCIWPAAMTINFALVPLQFQVLFSNVIGLFWNIILSYIANQDRK
jgi:protein Mpv17